MSWRLAVLLACAAASRAAAYHPGDLIVGAEPSDGGALAVRFDFTRRVHVSPSVELGGVVLHTGTDPGFDGLEFDEPPLAPLEPGTPVSVEVVALDGPVSVQVKGPILEAPGHAAFLGTMTSDGDGLHVHPTWRLATPDAATVVQACLRFRLVTTARYAPSPVYTVVITNAAADAPLPPPPACATSPADRCAGEALGSRAAILCRHEAMRQLVDEVPAPDRAARRVARGLFGDVDACGRLIAGADGAPAARAARRYRRALDRLAAFDRLTGRAHARGTLPADVAASLRAAAQALRDALAPLVAAQPRTRSATSTRCSTCPSSRRWSTSL